MNQITYDLFLRIAARTLENNGQSLEVLDKSGIEAALARPFFEGFGLNPYPTIHDKAACLLHSLITTQYLADGNKRTSLATASFLYYINGYLYKLPTFKDCYPFLMSITRDELSIEEIKIEFQTWFE